MAGYCCYWQSCCVVVEVVAEGGYDDDGQHCVRLNPSVTCRNDSKCEEMARLTFDVIWLNGEQMTLLQSNSMKWVFQTVEAQLKDSHSAP